MLIYLHNLLCSSVVGQVGVTTKVKVTNVIARFADNLKIHNVKFTIASIISRVHNLLNGQKIRRFVFVLVVLSGPTGPIHTELLRLRKRLHMQLGSVIFY